MKTKEVKEGRRIDKLKNMNTPIKLQNGLFAVPVPKESTKHYISLMNYLIYEMLPEFKGFKGPCRFDLLEGSYEILGEVKKDSISFDAKPYIKSVFNGTLQKYFYHDYNQSLYDMPSYPFRDYKQSFMSILFVNGLHFENPYGKEKPFIYDKDTDIEREYLLRKWQTTENNLIEKLIILKEI